MSGINERTMEIRVIPEGRKYRIVAHSPSGDGEAVTEAPKRFRADVEELQNAVLRGAQSRRGNTGINIGQGTDDRIIAEFGARLHSFLFQGDVASLFQKSLDEAMEAGVALRLKLRTESVRELSRVPWEAIYDGRSRTFLSCELKTLFTRGVDARELRLRRPRQLHILGMIAGPTTFQNEPLARLDVDLERARIERALAPLKQRDKVTLSWTISGTYRDFRWRLHAPDSPDEGWTIFHFIGHGDFDEETEQGFLIFEEAGSLVGEARYGDSLSPLLTEPKGPQLVVLNACNGARSSSGDLFSSTAAALALAGVPAVIAMQFPVSDAMAIAFSTTFYELLAEGYTIHKALAQTRIELKGRKMTEWISPVLYMQSSDGHLVVS